MTNSQRLSSERKLTTWQKIAFGLGDIYGGGTSVLIGFYYLIFLTDVVRISPALAGTVILISKVYDAITDPLEGVISDRTRTRLGRRRPYLLAGIPLIFLSLLALYYPVDFSQELHRFLFVIGAYLFFSTIVSIVMLNYNALQAELTLDYNERTALSGIRIFFSTVASIVAALVPLEIVKQFSDIRQGYIVMGTTFGLLFALPFLATALTARERPEFQRPPEKLDLRKTFFQPFEVRTFVVALLMYLFAFVAIDTVGSVVAYFMKYYLVRPAEISFVNGALLVAQVVALPFHTRLSARRGKRIGFILGGVIWGLAMAFSLLVGPGNPPFVVYLFAVLAGLGTGGIIVMIYAIFPDIPDVDELRSGERREGTYAALVTFMRKLSSALGIFLVSTFLELAGYIRPVESVVDGVTTLVDQAQSPEFVLVLRLVFFLVPTLLLSLSLFFAWRYPLTPDVHRRLNRVLAASRQGGEATPELAAEREDLIQLLVSTNS